MVLAVVFTDCERPARVFAGLVLGLVYTVRRMYHPHLRKRITKALEPYPARSVWKRVLDRVVFAAGIIGPVVTIPQLALIYVGHNAAGVSAVSWFGWAILDIPWILYGLVHKERPILVTYSLWLVINLAVAAGAVLYS